MKMCIRDRPLGEAVEALGGEDPAQDFFLVLAVRRKQPHKIALREHDDLAELLPVDPQHLDEALVDALVAGEHFLLVDCQLGALRHQAQPLDPLGVAALLGRAVDLVLVAAGLEAVAHVAGLLLARIHI